MQAYHPPISFIRKARMPSESIWMEITKRNSHSNSGSASRSTCPVMSIATNNHLLFGELLAMKYPGPAEHSSLKDSLGTWSRWQRSRHSPAWLQNYGQLMR